jgi:hypothetical protein
MAALVFVLRARYIKVPFLAFGPLTLAAGRARELMPPPRRRSNYAFTMHKRLSSLDMNMWIYSIMEIAPA